MTQIMDTKWPTVRFSLLNRRLKALTLFCGFCLAGFFISGPLFTAFAQENQTLVPEALPGSIPENDPNNDLTFDSGDFDFEKTPEELEREARDDAFDAALQGLLPLKPEEIRRLLEHFDRTQESVALPVYPPPKPKVAIETLSLDPGTPPTTVKVSYGYVTTLNILDATGEPWPIQDITWAGDFEVVQEGGGDDATHFIRITPQSEFAFGNMSIHMLTLKTPIIISLETSRDLVHYRFDAIIPEAGPLAKAPLIERNDALQAGDVNIASFLEGISPPGAERLNVSGVDGRTSAFRYNGMTYLRTPLTLLSPGWTSSASSADGMRVYALRDAPVVLLSEKGRVTRARLSSREDISDEKW